MTSDACAFLLALYIYTLLSNSPRRCGSGVRSRSGPVGRPVRARQMADAVEAELAAAEAKLAALNEQITALESGEQRVVFCTLSPSSR